MIGDTSPNAEATAAWFGCHLVECVKCIDSPGAHCRMNSILQLSAGAFEPSVDVLFARIEMADQIRRNTHESQARTNACFSAMNSENGRTATGRARSVRSWRRRAAW